jgi:hypothetical protein
VESIGQFLHADEWLFSIATSSSQARIWLGGRFMQSSDTGSRCVLRSEDEGFEKTSHCDAAVSYWYFSPQPKFKVGAAGVIE